MKDSLGPYLTESLPGIGGEIRRSPEDFQVEEIPLYEARGSGNHAYMTIEKSGIDTLGAIRRLAQALKRPERDFGYAGIKDAHAKTIQRVSIEDPDRSEFSSLSVPGITIRKVEWHSNKLKVGHLRGNRFSVKVLDSHQDALKRTDQIMTVLSERGVPNYFGPQRFGVWANTHRIGKAWLLGEAQRVFDELIDPDGGEDRFSDSSILEPYRQGDFEGTLRLLPSSAVHERRALQAIVRCRGDLDRALSKLDRRYVRLAASAYQSRLFNQILVSRMPHIDGLMEGDLAFIHEKGAVFRVTDLEAELKRAATFELSPSGPLFGTKMVSPSGVPGNLEETILAEEALPEGAFRPLRRLGMKGARRPLRVPLTDASVVGEDSGIVVSFSLPPGAYATVVLREIMKNGE